MKKMLKNYLVLIKNLTVEKGNLQLELGEKDYWGKGFGAEALSLLLNYAFLELNLHRVSLRVFSFNGRAINLYQKLGFIEEGISRQCLYRDGKWHDIVHMGVLKEEYMNKKSALTKKD